jgi:hypothetical protein
MSENLVLNPVEFTPELPEVSLTTLGLEMLAQPGPDYGESSVTVQRVKKAISEGVTDASWPPVECTIPLKAFATEDAPIADPLHRLDAWVGEVQRRRSGWIRRDFDLGGGFAGSVGCPVDSAGLTPPQGWVFSHAQVAPDIVLKFSRYPIWYATTEILAGEAEGTDVRDLQVELAELLGTAPGLIRVVVTNEGEEDWRGCSVSLECDDYSDAETAEPVYSAKDLTLQGGSEVAEDEAGDEVVKCPALTKGWVTVLSSKIDGVGHMTHVGPRRMVFRLDDVSAVLGDVQWKLDARYLGAASWVQTMEASTPIVRSSPVIGDYQLLDMGGCRPERAITGDQRWEWRLRARSLSGSGKRPLIRDVYPMSTEQWARVADASASPIDGEPTLSPGKAEDDSGIGTVAWEIPGELGGYAEAKLLQEAGATTSHYLKATQFGFALPESAVILGIVASVTRRIGSTGTNSVSDKSVKLVKKGTVSGTDHALSGDWTGGDVTVAYGSGSDLWGLTWTAAQINESGFGVAISAKASATRHARIDGISITVYYAESANSLAHICVAGRSMEFADNGVRRQQAEDDSWGELVPKGFSLYSPPSGQVEGRTARALIIPSVGDFAARADKATVSPGAKVYGRPAYLFAREAA